MASMLITEIIPISTFVLLVLGGIGRILRYGSSIEKAVAVIDTKVDGVEKKVDAIPGPLQHQIDALDHRVERIEDRAPLAPQSWGEEPRADTPAPARPPRRPAPLERERGPRTA